MSYSQRVTNLEKAVIGQSQPTCRKCSGAGPFEVVYVNPGDPDPTDGGPCPECGRDGLLVIVCYETVEVAG